MRVLIVAVNLERFVFEQYSALKKAGVDIITYKVSGHGVFGYLREAFKLREVVKRTRPDIVHAHYGLSGLCANFQRNVPVVTTFHGSDIHSGGWILKLSQLAMRFSVYNIFVCQGLYKMSGYKRHNVSIIPCGTDLKTMKPIDRAEAKEMVGKRNTFVLFAGSFTNQIKNPELAKRSVSKLPQVELVELRGYKRDEVNMLMNAANCLLMTSHREGAPLVVKEAMACGTPVVSVDVGDVREVIGETAGCYIAERNEDDIADKVRQALEFHGKTEGRQRIIDLGLDNRQIAQQLIEIYQQCLKK